MIGIIECDVDDTRAIAMQRKIVVASCGGTTNYRYLRSREDGVGVQVYGKAVPICTLLFNSSLFFFLFVQLSHHIHALKRASAKPTTWY